MRRILNLEKMSEEICAWVDDQDQLLGGVARSLLRRDHLLHRASYIFVYNRSLESLYIHLRTSTKDYCPSYWDLAAGGVVQFGESYEDNAERELNEEYGLSSVKLEKVCCVLCKEQRVWGGVFLVEWEGKVEDLVPQPEEVVRIELRKIEDIVKMEELYTPDSVVMLEHLLKEKPDLRQRKEMNAKQQINL